MRVVVAPDSFGGTLSATEAAAAIADGWRRAAPGDELELLPVADGGTGFVDVLHAVLGGTLHAVRRSPARSASAVAARWLQVGDTAYVESAAACGLHLVPRDAAHPGGRGRRHHPRGGGAGGGRARRRCREDRDRPGRLRLHRRRRRDAGRARRRRRRRRRGELLPGGAALAGRARLDGPSRPRRGPARGRRRRRQPAARAARRRRGLRPAEGRRRRRRRRRWTPRWRWFADVLAARLRRRRAGRARRRRGRRARRGAAGAGRASGCPGAGLVRRAGRAGRRARPGRRWPSPARAASTGSRCAASSSPPSPAAPPTVACRASCWPARCSVGRARPPPPGWRPPTASPRTRAGWKRRWPIRPAPSPRSPNGSAALEQLTRDRHRTTRRPGPRRGQ